MSFQGRATKCITESLQDLLTAADSAILLSGNAEDFKIRQQKDGLAGAYAGVAGAMTGTLRTISSSVAAHMEYYLPMIERHEKIISALESIGISFEDSDIAGLEALAYSPSNRHERGTVCEALNGAISEALEESREAEMEGALSALRVAGFVLDEEDGETWTKGTATVKVMYDHPADSTYKWEFDNGVTGADHWAAEGRSGAFDTLLTLIATKTEGSGAKAAEGKA